MLRFDLQIKSFHFIFVISFLSDKSVRLKKLKDMHKTLHFFFRFRQVRAAEEAEGDAQAAGVSIAGRRLALLQAGAQGRAPGGQNPLH